MRPSSSRMFVLLVMLCYKARAAVTTVRGGTRRPSSAEIYWLQPTVKLSRMLDLNLFGKDSRQGRSRREGRAPTILTLGWAGPSWSECLWPFVRICVFFMRWVSVVRWRTPYGIQSPLDCFETMGSAFTQLDAVLLLLLNSVLGDRYCKERGKEINLKIIFTLIFFLL